MSSHFVDLHVGKRLRRYRKMLFITQQDLANMLDISSQQVQKYETGKSRIGASRLYDISDKMNIPVAYFFEGLEGNTKEQNVEFSNADINYSQEVRELVSIYSKVDCEEVKKKMLDLVKAISLTTAKAKQEEDSSDDNVAEKMQLKA